MVFNKKLENSVWHLYKLGWKTGNDGHNRFKQEKSWTRYAELALRSKRKGGRTYGCSWDSLDHTTPENKKFCVIRGSNVNFPKHDAHFYQHSMTYTVKMVLGFFCHDLHTKKKKKKWICYQSRHQNVEAKFYSTCLEGCTHLCCNHGNGKECQKQKRDKLCHWGDGERERLEYWDSVWAWFGFPY